MSDESAIIARLELTMPDQKAEHLCSVYASATVILEYGVGGSTVLYSETAGKIITSAETDQEWVDKINAWLAQNLIKSMPNVIWANIGPTKAWGQPTNKKSLRDFAKYPLKICSLDDISQPDIVFIDGRFRAGCVLATAFSYPRAARRAPAQNVLPRNQKIRREARSYVPHGRIQNKPNADPSRISTRDHHTDAGPVLRPQDLLE